MGSVFSSTSLEALPPLKDVIFPTPETYVTLINIFQYFPMFTIIQWLTSWYPAGKTSMRSSYLNIPGRIGWFIMEITGPLNLLYILWKLPEKLQVDASLPLPNKLVLSLYLLHYANRAIISPFFAAPSMSPMHVFVVSSAVLFNWFNSSCLAGWLAGYPVATIPEYPTSNADNGILAAPTFLLYLGMGLFFIGMTGNIYSERTLFRLRREEADRRSAKKSDTPTGTTPSSSSSPSSKSKNKYTKVYVVPPARGVFRSILYPHFVFEWIEWLGFALVGTLVVPRGYPASLATSAVAGAGGAGALHLRLAPWHSPAVRLAEKLHIPALPLPPLVFVVNAVANMLPHARWGRKWYLDRFGEEAVAGRGAVVPYCSWL